MTKTKSASPIFTAPSLPAHHIDRPRELEAVAQLLLESSSSSVAITTALQGGGGFGKTTLALALCHDRRIRHAYPDGVLWIVFGERPDLIGLLIDQIKLLTDEPITFGDINAARARFRELIDDRRMLIVLDDVWQDDHARQFLDCSPHSARLITTRRQDVVARLRARQPVEVNEMQTEEAASLLVKWLDEPPADLDPFRQVARELGEWPLLLELAGGYLREVVTLDQQSPNAALQTMRERLHTRGFTAFDRTDETQRNAAIRSSLNLSLERLGEQHQRFIDMAVFPEDTAIPFVTIFRLWRETAGLSEIIAKDTLKTIQRLSLFTHYDPANKTVRLHDVIRALLRAECSDLRRLHDHLLDANRRLLPVDHSQGWGPGWAGLSQGEPYLWDYLAYHLTEAKRKDELIDTVKDLRYLAAKTQARNAFATDADLMIASLAAPEDTTLRLLKRNFANMTHLLNNCSTPNEIGITVLSRLMHLPELEIPCSALEVRLHQPYLKPWRTLPDLPHPALMRTLTGHNNWVRACAISPNGQWIVSASLDNALKVWDVASGSERITLIGHADGVNACAVSPNGQRIVSAADDFTLKVWDVAGGAELQTLTGHTRSVSACAVSPDGRRIVSASDDHTLKIWNATSGIELHTLTGHTDRVNACAVSPDGRWIISASSDHTLKVWDTISGTEHLTLTGHTDRVNACAVSPDGRWIVSASSDHTLIVWDLSSGTRQSTLIGHKGWVRACAVSPDGHWIVSASEDKTLKLWNSTSGVELLTLSGHTSGVTACAVGPDGQWLISTSDDGSLKMWEAFTTTGCLTMIGHHDWVRACTVDPSGQWLVSASDDQTLKVWDIATGAERLTLRGHTDRVNACAVSPDGQRIVSASRDNTLKVWDIATGTERFSLIGHTDGVHGCAVSPDGQWIVSASHDKTLKVWDMATGAERLTHSVGHTDRVNDCAVSPDGQWIVSASWDNTLKVWEAAGGAERLTLLGHTDGVLACAVSPDGQWIVSASWDGALKIWGVVRGTEHLALTGHSYWARACVISLDGQQIVSVSWDNTLKVWNAADGTCVTTFRTNDALNDCALLLDKEHVVAVGARGVYWLRLVR